jgi:hypothetical protein
MKQPTREDYELAAKAALGNPDDLAIAKAFHVNDGKRSKSSIAQAIRDAAVNWPQFLGDVESQILHAFCGDWARSAFKNGNIQEYLAGAYGTEGEMKARTFMLLVVEALES